MRNMKTRKSKKGTREPVSHLAGWQTVTDAERESSISRQWIHKLVSAKKVPHKAMLGVILVPKPFPYARIR